MLILAVFSLIASSAAAQDGQRLWSLGTSLFGQDRFPEAAAALTRLVSTAQKPGPAYALLALCEYETRDYEKSAAHFRQWVQAGAPGPKELITAANFRRALLFTREGRYDEALALLRAAASGGDGGPELTEALGLALLHIPSLPEEYPPSLRESVWRAGKGKFRGQVRPPAPPAVAPRRTSSLPQLSFEQASRRAEELRQAGSTEEAIPLYLRALELQPSWKEGLWYASTLLYEKERYPEARDLLRRFVAHEPSAGPGWTLLGLSEFQSREYARALAHLQRGLDLGIADRKDMTRSAYHFVAMLLTRFERFDESLDLLVRMARLGERGTLMTEAAGLAALRLPLLPAEIASARREMVRLTGAAVCAMANSRNDEAEGALKQLAAAYPNEPGVHFLLGAFLLRDRPDEGIAEIERELEISPDHVAARTRLAEEYLKLDKLDEARARAGEAVKLDPKSSPAHLCLGEVLLAAGDARGAVRELETARELTPWVSRVRWVLSKAYTAAGRGADAAREAGEVERLKAEEKRRLF
ncbi:MAG: tetratricopeptide repeat protein [Acidobacteriota bacterium]